LIASSAALKAAGITKRAAATLTGIPLTTLSRRLTGASPFLVTELPALARVLCVPVSDLAAAAEAAHDLTHGLVMGWQPIAGPTP
jgi:hypothetical protein